MAKKKAKKVVRKKAAKKVIKTNDLPNITFGEAIRTMLKANNKKA
jgi:hypothetical protein